MRILVVTSLLFCSFDSSAWEYVEDVDAMTDEVRRKAYVEDAEGNRFSIYRIEPGGQVFVNFRLSHDGFDQIDSEKLGMYRIDKLEPYDFRDSRRLSELFEQAGGSRTPTFEWTPKWVNFLFWHGQEQEGLGGVKRLVDGNTLIFRYYLPTGGYKETAFNIEGGANEISRALQLSSLSADERAEVERMHEQEAELISEGYEACKQENEGDAQAIARCMLGVIDEVKQSEQD